MPSGTGGEPTLSPWVTQAHYRPAAKDLRCCAARNAAANRPTETERTAMTFLAIGPLGLGALLGAAMAAGAVDTGIYVHGLLLVAFCVVGIFWVINRDGDTVGP